MRCLNEGKQGYRVSSIASTKTLLMKFNHPFIVTDDVYVQLSFGEN